MQETIESYTQMEQEAARLQERRKLLEEIADQHGEYRRLCNQIRTNQYIADRADCDLAARETEAAKQAFARKTQKLKQDRLALKEKQQQREEIHTQYIHVKTELASSGLQQHIEELEKAQAELKRQMVTWQAAYNKRNQDFSHLAAGWQEVLRGCDALLMEQTEVLGARTKVSLETFAHKKRRLCKQWHPWPAKNWRPSHCRMQRLPTAPCGRWTAALWRCKIMWNRISGKRRQPLLPLWRNRNPCRPDGSAIPSMSLLCGKPWKSGWRHRRRTVHQCGWWPNCGMCGIRLGAMPWKAISIPSATTCLCQRSHTRQRRLFITPSKIRCIFTGWQW